MPAAGSARRADLGARTPDGDTGLLAGKNLLITGVITEASMAFHTARLAQEQGAPVVLTGYGRMSLVERIASGCRSPRRSSSWTSPTRRSWTAWPTGCREHRAPGLDGVLHSIGFAPATALGGASSTRRGRTSRPPCTRRAYSLKSLAVAALPLMTDGGSIVGMDFDARQAWPAYDWMGVAKAALESITRYLARDLGPKGIRVNLVAAGPIRTMAAKSIPGFSAIENAWTDRAPLGWDTSDPTPVARAACALLSDLFPATSGSMVRVDGGFHALGV